MSVQLPDEVKVFPMAFTGRAGIHLDFEPAEGELRRLAWRGFQDLVAASDEPPAGFVFGKDMSEFGRGVGIVEVQLDGNTIAQVVRKHYLNSEEEE